MLFLANLMAGIGSLLAGASSSVCYFALWDEPKYPEQLLK